MNLEPHHNYHRIAKAIQYIQQHFQKQPDLDEVARQIHLSPFHFQRIFTEWAGVSPKKFLQYTSLEYAKSLLKDQQATLFDAAQQTGLSGTGRLHDLFISIEGMTPAEYKNGGKMLSISYDFLITPFGRSLMATTEKGICFINFLDDGEKSMDELYQYFPNAKFKKNFTFTHEKIQQLFKSKRIDNKPLKLHLKGTPFQLKVWEALLKIPEGQLTTYATMASTIESPKASRAVGSAIGKNPVAFLIPCHRVIQASGLIGGYRWGSIRKKAMIGWEAARYKAFWNDRLDELEVVLKSEN